MNRRIWFFSVLILMGFLNITHGYAGENKKKAVVSKEFQKSFTVKEHDLFFADNHYGEINISYWDHDEVLIRVNIEVKASVQEDAQEVMERIRVNLEREGNQIKAITEVGRSQHKNCNYSIRYFVTLPASLAAHISQQYGTIRMPEENQSDYHIEVKYGTFEAGNFSRSLYLKAAYSKATLGNLSQLTLKASYCGQVSGKSADQVTAECKYSNLFFQSIGRLELEEKYGNATIGKISHSLIAGQLSYSNLKIKDLSSGFDRIKLNTRYSNIELSVSPKASFSVLSENTRYGSCELSRSLRKTSVSQDSDRSPRLVEINGGNGGKITFDGGGYSNLKIRSL